MRQLRIYIAIETFLPLVGGAERQAFLQGKYLREQGIDTTIITMHFQHGWSARDSLGGVPVLRVAGHILSWRERVPGVLRRFYYLLALLALGRRLWKCRREYDILHVFQFTPFALPALLVCWLARKPLIIAMRCDGIPAGECLPACGKRLRTGADLETLERLGRPILWLMNCQLRRMQASITILSARMRERLRRCGLDGARVLLIPNGVDTSLFRPCPGVQERVPTVVCVAKLRYQKGVDILLRAWRKVVEQRPEARLLIVGDGPLFDELRCLAASLGVTSSVEFTGLCTDVVQHLQRGHIAVLPSRWEGMPNALLEAMSCGLACVATRVSGSEDLLSQSERGVLVEPGDGDALAAALLFLLKNPELARDYGRAARQHIEQQYSFEQIMQRYIDLYADVARNIRAHA